MNTARRNFLKLGTITAATIAMPLGAIGRAGKSAPPSFQATGDEYDALSYLTAEDFKPFAGGVFKAQSASGTTSVILAEVQDAATLNPSAATKTGTIAPAAGQGTFALRFRGISGKPLEQGTYVFQNKAFPPFAMFIVPSSSHPANYLGLVNRSVQ
jgi:hypothetical protein